MLYLKGMDTVNAEKVQTVEETALLWKEIGGNLSALKVHGRWYFLGTTNRELRQAAVAFKLERVQGMPAAIERLFRLHGRTTAALKRLPTLHMRRPT